MGALRKDYVFFENQGDLCMNSESESKSDLSFSDFFRISNEQTTFWLLVNESHFYIFSHCENLVFGAAQPLKEFMHWIAMLRRTIWTEQRNS